jgi:predicted ester cyclase
MTSQDNKALDQQFVEQVFNNDKSELFKNYYAPEIVEHMLADATMLRKAFPDLHYIIEDQIAEEDKVVTRWTASGTHRGELVSTQQPNSPPFAPTGKRVSWGGVTISRLAGGKYVEQWNNVDMLSLLQQLGAINLPGL